MNDSDNISRALEAHPTPWKMLIDGSGSVFTVDANEFAVEYHGDMEDIPGELLNSVRFRVEAVNAYAANLARDEQVKALVDVAQNARAQINDYINDPDMGQQDCDMLHEVVDGLDIALAPFTQEPTP
jgi:hypothetical protein